jgi:hypothetical protein
MSISYAFTTMIFSSFNLVIVIGAYADHNQELVAFIDFSLQVLKFE